jgi:hypothetical protein
VFSNKWTASTPAKGTPSGEPKIETPATNPATQGSAEQGSGATATPTTKDTVGQTPNNTNPPPTVPGTESSSGG